MTATDSQSLAKSIDVYRTQKAEALDDACIPSPMAHDANAQAALVGQMIRFPEVAFRMRRLIPPEAFYGYRMERIVSAIYDVVEAKKTIDIVLLRDRLRRIGELELSGGETFLMELTDAVVSPVTAIAHARIVHEYWVCRKVYSWGRDLVMMWGESIPVDVIDAIKAVRNTCALVDGAISGLENFARAERKATRRRKLTTRRASR